MLYRISLGRHYISVVTHSQKRILVRKYLFGSFLPFFLLFLGNQLAAQRCATDEVNALHKSQMTAEELRHEEEIELQYQNSVGDNQRGGMTTRVIPVVVHLIQMTPAEDISDARVQSQIDVLNEDFQFMNADTSLIPIEFQNIAADCNIRFCLATIDPNGCPTDGINRVVAPQLAIHGIADESALKGYVQWPPQQYLNMWVPVNLRDNLLGYATFPTWLASNPQNDGVVINGKNFGRGFGTPASTYNLGRTATHEVGHWLGLFHTFQGGCSGNTAANCQSQGDRVCDTPPTSSANYSCPGVKNTCTETPTDLNDQTMNYMDYVDDACMYMYSQGQSDRATFFLDNERSQIWSPANLTATGCDGTQSPGCIPIADFSANKKVVCTQDSVTFNELTNGSASAWNWTFQAGSPGNSTAQSPKVAWSTAGTYEVEMIATNNIGADTIVKTAFIEVIDPSAQGFTSEGFEQVGTDFPLGWYATDEFGAAGFWKPSSGYASEGLQSIRLDNFSNTAPESVHYLYSKPYDFANANGGNLYFDRAYKRRSSFVYDSLQILVSVDCGNTWQKVWEKTGPSLATVGGYRTSSEYLPNPSDWVTDSINLNPYIGASSIRFCFRGVGGNSQSIHLDYLRLNILTANEMLVGTPFSLTVSNNPFQIAPRLEINGQMGSIISGNVVDVQGKVVMHLPSQRLSSNLETLEISDEKWQEQREGLYFLVLTDGTHKVARKLLKIAAK